MISTANEPLWHWLFLVVPVLGLVLVATRHVLGGDPGDRHGLTAVVERFASSIRATSGVPAWVAAGTGLAVWSLLLAAGFGVYWDVSWHIDLGRDKALFTVPHTLILTGLFGIMLSGFVAIALATHEKANVAWRFGRFRIPRGGLVLLVLGACAFVGFPLDDLWHKTYGIDVTLWSPTHETMIFGAVLSPLGMWLLNAEAGAEARGRWRRGITRITVAGLLLTALSVQHLEFDNGVPQWQAVLQPVLIMLSAALCLVAARAAFGRGWALLIVAFFLGVRTLVTVLVGGLLGLTAPHFPLYLGEALVVEAAFIVAERRGWQPLSTALLAGLGTGTIGLATEWGWSQIFGRDPWRLSLLSGIWIAVLVALLAALVGMALGRLSRGEQVGFPGVVASGALVAMLCLVAVAMPRQGTQLSATMRLTNLTTDTSASHIVSARKANVELDLNPRNGAENADVFRVITWQGGAGSPGGGAVATQLREDQPGVWRSAAPVNMPVQGKTIVFLSRGSVVAAAPVSFPADPEYGLGPIEPRATRQVDFAPSSALLLREAHSGNPAVAVIAYVAFILVAIAWLVLVAVAFRGLAPSRPRPPASGRQSAARRPRRVQPAGR